MKHLALVTLFPILLTACQQEKIEIPDTGRKIVINGLITTDRPINVKIQKSVSLKTFWDDGYANNDSSSVYIYQNESCIDSLYYIRDSDYDHWGSDILGFSNYWSKNVLPLPGKEYKILVKRKGLPDATSKITIPNIVKIESLDTSRIKIAPDTLEGYWGGDFLYFNDRLICNFEFTDPANETNYYYFDVNVRQYKFWINSSLDSTIFHNISSGSFDCQDPIIEEKLDGGNGLAALSFSDKMINGGKSKFTISLSLAGIAIPYYGSFTPLKTVVDFRLLSITKEFYTYIQNLKLYSKNYNNPLAEPVLVNSNVIGGYGIFTGAAVSTYSIVFKY